MANRLKEKTSLFIINSLANGIFSNSDSVKSIFDINNYKYKYIPNAVEVKSVDLNVVRRIRLEMGIDFSTVVIGNVGRNHPDKNHSLIFEIFEALSRRMPNIVLLCVGRDYDRTFRRHYR